MDIHKKLQDIFRDVFESPTLEINDDTFVDDIQEWDSLANIMIITAVEKEFDMHFDLREIIILSNVGDMIDLIKKKLPKKEEE